MKIILSIFVTFSLIFSGEAEAKKESTSYVDWVSDGRCGEFTPSGRLIRLESTNKSCRERAKSGKPYVNWTKAGGCAEFTPSGKLMRHLKFNKLCRERAKSGDAYVNWTKSGKCAEFTPGGNFIRSAKLDTCRKSAKSGTKPPAVKKKSVALNPNVIVNEATSAAVSDPSVLESRDVAAKREVFSMEDREEAVSLDAPGSTSAD